MKIIYRLISITILFAFLCLMPGCSSTDTGDTPAIESSAEAQSVLPTATAEPTAEPTPIPTTEPDIESTFAPAPTPEPSDDVGKAVLAEGFYYIALNDEIKARITGMSYPADDENLAIGYDDLRYISLLYYDFDGNVQNGELIVNAVLADEVMEIFYALYQAKYPFTSIRLVDDYGEPGDDNLSMAANNTSAFNYRYVTGSDTLSRHSYGAAIDVNPVLNPYIDGDRIAPENGARYADRTLDLPGMIDHDDLCYKLFVAHGWTWGGDWSGDKDYQHFSKDIGF
ncbi:MAG: M15 family metallopeptidase [Eubacteriales bacterium]|nr:M15 family metallopeptidase [Eubacteriales bacterium]